jgi:hypothetical protein
MEDESSHLSQAYLPLQLTIPTPVSSFRPDKSWGILRSFWYASSLTTWWSSATIRLSVMDFIQLLAWYVFFSFLLLLRRYLCNSIFHLFRRPTLSRIRPGYISFIANFLAMPTASITSKASSTATSSRFFHHRYLLHLRHQHTMHYRCPPRQSATCTSPHPLFSLTCHNRRH